MRLAYVQTDGRGETDRLLGAVADRLGGDGVRLAGVVQSNTDCEDGSRCDMDLRILPGSETIRISQSLGRGSRGCRLDAAALEHAVGLVQRALAGAPQLLIVNKFGKHEGDGRGFRPVIAEALLQGLPVLLGVNALNAARFADFAGPEATLLPPEQGAIRAWVDTAIASTLAAQ